MPVACLTIGFVPTEGLRWSESQHSVSPMPRARGGDRDGTVAGVSGSLPNILPNPNTNLNPNPVWSRQRELLMHLLPWYTAAAAAAQAQPGNPVPPFPGLSGLQQGMHATSASLHAIKPIATLRLLQMLPTLTDCFSSPSRDKLEDCTPMLKMKWVHTIKTEAQKCQR